jgi:hypothetical protein
MGGGGDEVAETAQQRAMTEHALQQLTDYRERWLPLQRNLAEQVTAMGEKGSTARRAAAGKTATDTAVKFAGAQDQLGKTLSAQTGLGSSRAKLAITGLGEDAARSKGLGLTAADQRVDDAYTQSLGALTKIGQGEKVEVANGLANQAIASSRQAATDADISLQQRMGYGQMGGQVLGLGLQQGMSAGTPKAPAVSTGSDPTGMNGTMNNPSAYVAPSWGR